MKYMRLIRIMRYNMIRLIRIKDGAHQLALGFVAGFFPCWFPTFGVGPLFTIALTRWVKGNMVAAIVAASIGSVLWPFLFYINYLVGKLFTDNWRKVPDLDEEYTITAEHVVSLTDMGKDFIIGSILNSIFLSLAGYWLLRAVLTSYRPQMYRWIKKRNRRKRIRLKQNAQR